MRIKRLFSYIHAIYMAIFLLSGGTMLVVKGREYAESSAATHDIANLALALKFMEDASRERGPTNALLGAPLPHDPVRIERLKTARDATDKAYSDLIHGIVADGRPEYTRIIAGFISAHTRLLSARDRVDALIATPIEARPPDAIAAEILNLFGVIDDMSQPMFLLGAIAPHNDPQIRNALTIARLAADMREQAGRIGSHLTQPLLSQAPLSDQDVATIQRTHGRIELYYEILQRYAMTYADIPEVNVTMKNVETQYYGRGLGYVDRVIHHGSDGHYGITPAEFADHYVPQMASIAKFRDVLLQIAEDNAARNVEDSRNSLISVVAAALILLITYLAMARKLRRTIIGPLLSATDMVLDIAGTRRDGDAIPQKDSDEIHGLMRAAAMLESALHEKNQIEIERRRLKERDQEARRLEALGQLAGGIAHDFNNMLGAILGYATLIEEDSTKIPSTHRHADRILGAARRGKSLVEQLLILTGRLGKSPVRFFLAELVADTVADLERDIPSGATLHALPDDFAAEIEADRKQVGGALRNLCANGLEALNGRSGTVAIAIRPPDLDSEPLRRLHERNRPDLAWIVDIWQDETGTVWAVTGHLPTSKNWVALTVSDSGSGMDTALLEQAFSPFFTTHERARHPGIGLSVVQGVVLAHGGALVIRTRSGEGTTVEIILPRIIT